MKFSRTYEVRFSEADRRGCITPVALYNYLQETAVYHGESPRKSGIALSEKGLAWVLTRILIKFIRYPKHYDEVLVTTWASNLSGLYAVREWTAEDHKGDIYARATSRWILLDIQKRRPIRLPAFIAEYYGVVDERAIDFSFPRTTPIEHGTHHKRFHVRASELDSNQHANSACYVDWCLETSPADVLAAMEPEMLDITYKQESVLADELDVIGMEETSPENGLRSFKHAIRLAENGRLLTIADSRWRTPDTGA